MNFFKNLFKSPVITDTKLRKKLGDDVFISNGVGYGFISNENLYHSGHLSVGFGRTTSGYGDWGGGFDTSTCPIFLTIDKNYIIHTAKSDSFYNSRNSEDMAKIADKIINKIKLGETKLEIKDEFIKESIDKIFEIMPCKHVIDWDAVRHEHMLDSYLNIEERGEYNIPDSDSIDIAKKRNQNIEKILKN